MPDYAQPPQPADLQAKLTEANLYDGAWGLDLSDALARSVEQWGIDTEFKPFQAAAEDSTRHFTAPGGNRHQGGFGIASPGALPVPVGGGHLLVLGGGLISLTSLTVDRGDGAQAYTAGADFFLEDEEAPQDNWPYTSLRFPRPLLSLPQGIAITGKWGFCVTWPATAFDAVVLGAAIRLVPSISTRRRVTAESDQQQVEKARQSGTVRVEFAVQNPAQVTDLAMIESSWKSDYRASVQQYRMVDL